jgi:hypothetical protein
MTKKAGMPTRYELWDARSGNIVADFASEDEALDSVRETVRTLGRAAAADLMLGTNDLAGEGALIAEGDVLIDRAEQYSVARRA